MSERFDFDAPQYIDHCGADDPLADRFFDVQAALEEIQFKPVTFTEDKIIDVNEEMSENKDPVGASCKPVASSKISPARAVLHDVTPQVTNVSSSDIADSLSVKLETLRIEPVSVKKSKLPVRPTQIFNGLPPEQPTLKYHAMTTRMDTLIKTPVLKLRSRNVVRPLTDTESVTSESNVTSSTVKPSFIPTKRFASPLQSVAKFRTLAEQVQYFHKATPDRFRYKPRRIFVAPTEAAKPCIPKSPLLRAVHRSRPVNFPTLEQREDLEMQELSKHRIRAQPVSGKVLKGVQVGQKVAVERKPATVPEPFNLTQVKKREVTPAEELFKFKAQPVPTRILQSPRGVPPRKVLALTEPQTPHMRVPARLRMPVQTSTEKSSTESVNKENAPRNTKLQPFSFDVKIKEAFRRKDDAIKKAISEDLKRTTCFKARAVPAFPMKGVERAPPTHTEPVPFKLTQPKPHIEEPKRTTPFKAQAAAVLHQKPFVPKVEKHFVTPSAEVHLRTEQRNVVRQRFEEMLKEQERQNRELLQQQQADEERKAQAEILDIRKRAEFKAQPVRKYKMVEIHGADPTLLTSPHSPQFRSGKKKDEP